MIATARQRIARLVVTAVVAVLVVLGAVALLDRPGAEPDAAVVHTSTTVRPFAPDSPFNNPIDDDVEIDPRSDAMVRLLSVRGHATAATHRFVPPVYDADADTPRYTMRCTKMWGPCDFESMRVPIPRGAAASRGSDANMVVIDWSTRQVFEFWQYRNDQETVSWGAVLPLDGTGTGNGTTDPGRYGAVGSGVSRLAGVIRTFEVTSGSIDHALVGVTGYACRNSFRYPAVKTDGWFADERRCIPQGARVQLDPDVRCRTLPGIESWEIAVCEALQIYGWYNIDNGPRAARGFTVQFENPHGDHDPYPGVGLTEYEPIDAIPLDRLRVLAAPNGDR